MYGKTNCTSGNGISKTSAILQIFAPTGSTVTISNNNISRSLNSSKSYIDTSRPTRSIYIFSISSSLYGTWNITATRELENNSTTILIDSTNNYEIYIGYHVPIDQYQEVEYVANTASVYIMAKNTDISRNIRIVARAAISVAGSDGLIAVEHSSDWKTRYRTEIYAYDNNWVTYTYDGTDRKYVAPWTANQLADIECIAQTNSGVTWTVNGLSNHENINPNICNRLYIFAYFGSKNYYCKGRIQHLQFYEDDILIRDMWACYRLSDSKAGMWDKVTNTFYEPSNGTLVAGGDV